MARVIKSISPASISSSAKAPMSGVMMGARIAVQADPETCLGHSLEKATDADAVASVNISSSSARARQRRVIACRHQVIADRLHEQGLPSGSVGASQILVLETEQPALRCGCRSRGRRSHGRTARGAAA
jgi:hypothetical protein